jgi:hypothetical protein
MTADPKMQPAAHSQRAASGTGPVRGGGVRLPFWVWYTTWIALCVGAAGLLHWSAHGIVNGWQLGLSLFLAINLVTCVQEIALGLRISTIEGWHHDPAARQSRPRGSMWLERVSPADLASATFWGRTWYEYAYYDPSYADRRSFGFAIDVGNGWTTLLPGAFFLVGMTVPLVSPVVLGIVGIVLFYQKLYGTCLYFFTFLFNRRLELNPLGRVLAVVGGSNGVWLVFPAIGLYVSVRLVLERSYDVLWR